MHWAVCLETKYRLPEDRCPGWNESSIDFLVRWWTNTAANDYLGVKSEVVFAIKQALDEAEIEIPFPYVTHTFKEEIPVAQPEKKAA